MPVKLSALSGKKTRKVKGFGEEETSVRGAGTMPPSRDAGLSPHHAEELDMAGLSL